MPRNNEALEQTMLILIVCIVFWSMLLGKVVVYFNLICSNTFHNIIQRLNNMVKRDKKLIVSYFHVIKLGNSCRMQYFGKRIFFYIW